jgi:hypothetical protein
MGVITPLFFWCLMPLSACAGDVTYVKRKLLFTPSQWPVAARRKACVMYRGKMHPTADGIFVTLVLEAQVKILLPCVVILTSSNPIEQMAIVSAIGALVFVASMIWEALADPQYRILKQGLNFATFVAYSFGLATVIFGKGTSWMTASFMGSEVLVLVVTVCLMSMKKLDASGDEPARHISHMKHEYKKLPIGPPEDLKNGKNSPRVLELSGKS